MPSTSKNSTKHIQEVPPHDVEQSPVMVRKRGGQPNNTNSVTHGAYATKTAATRRARRLRHRVARLKKDHPDLAARPRHLVQRYVEVEFLTNTLWTILAEDGMVNADGEPRRILIEYRHLLGELARLAATLGLTSPQDADSGAFPL